MKHSITVGRVWKNMGIKAESIMYTHILYIYIDVYIIIYLTAVKDRNGRALGQDRSQRTFTTQDFPLRFNPKFIS